MLRNRYGQTVFFQGGELTPDQMRQGGIQVRKSENEALLLQAAGINPLPAKQHGHCSPKPALSAADGTRSNAGRFTFRARLWWNSRWVTGAGAQALNTPSTPGAVSYTHLTLPTKDGV